MDPKRERLRQLLKDYYMRYYAELRTRLPNYATVPEQVPHFLRNHPRTITVIEYADGYVVTHRPSSVSKGDVGTSETFVIAADDQDRTVGEATGRAYLPHSDFDESEAPFVREVGSGEYAEPTDFELRDYVSNDKVARRTEEAARREAAEVTREFFEENPPMNLGRTLPGRKDRSARIRLPLPFWGWRSGRSPRGENAGVLYSLGFVALLIVGFSVYVGANILDDRGNQVERVATPASVPNPKEMERAAQQEADYLAHAMQAAAQTQTQKEPQNKEAAPQAQSPQPQTQVVAEPQAAAAVPTDTTMYLTIPKIGLYDIPVLEGTSEAVLSQGVGHVPGTGYPWAPGSNTYIAGHRLGYPGTISDHVFWDLPSLAMGDEIILEDSLGQSYTYQVSEVLEVPPSDMSVTSSTGADMVSLQTCIENYGDYWTAGPNWFVRYIVRAERVA